MDKTILAINTARNDGIEVYIHCFQGAFTAMYLLVNEQPCIMLKRHPGSYQEVVQAISHFLKIHWEMIVVDPIIIKGIPVWLY